MNINFKQTESWMAYIINMYFTCSRFKAIPVDKYLEYAILYYLLKRTYNTYNSV